MILNNITNNTILYYFKSTIIKQLTTSYSIYKLPIKIPFRYKDINQFLVISK